MKSVPVQVSRTTACSAISMFAFALLVGVAQSANAANLTVEIKGEIADKGTVMVALYKKDDKWMGKASDGKAIQAKKAGVSVTFNDLVEGEYAISMFLDENNNGKLDANAIGIPIEPYAFSNNATGSFGPPSFDQAKFAVGKESKSHIITLK